MKCCILGSGTLLPDPFRGAPAHWVETGRHRILMDCGAGTLRTMARLGLPWSRITQLLLTHLHTDHVGELASLLFALRHGAAPAREAHLEILGPRGLEEHVEHLARAHGSFVMDPGFPVSVRELPGGSEWKGEEDLLRVVTRSTPHTDASLAFRLDAAEGSVGYTGDTGPDPGLGAFFRGCRLLVAECSNPDDRGPDIHLSPRTLAAFAEEAGPELLVTVHAYPPLDPEAVPDLLGAVGYTGWARAGRDGMRIEWTDGPVEIVDPGGALGQGRNPLPPAFRPRWPEPPANP